MTTQSVINKLLRQYKRYGQTFLYAPSKYLYCFSNEILNDLVIQVRSNEFTKEPIYFDKNGEIYSKLSIKDTQNLYKKLQRLENINDDEFYLEKNTVSEIQNLIKDKNTPYTHIRFFAENNEVKVRVFDYKSFVNELYVKDRPITIYETSVEKTSMRNTLSFSINVPTFREIPISDCVVTTYGDDYIKFITKNDVSYCIRNQNIQEPIVKVTNDQPGQDIVFYFQPTTILASDHTNQ